MNEQTDKVFYIYGFTWASLRPKASPRQPPQNLGDVGRTFLSAGSRVFPAAPKTTGLECQVTQQAGTPAPSRLVLEATGMAEQHPPFLWPSKDLAAVVSLVWREEFCGPTAESNLQDVAWIGPRACRHQAVLEQVMSLGPILPARFGTLFSCLESLSDFMDKHREAVAGFLGRVAGQEEWSLKGLVDARLAEEELFAHTLAGQKESLASSPGSAYLQEQRLRIKVKQQLRDWLVEACEPVVKDLTDLASEVCPRRLLSCQTTGAEREMVLNWAFLVPQGNVIQLHGRIQRANAEHTARGLAFDLSGPWPPYSFCPSL